MSLMDHAMNILGVAGKVVGHSVLKPGRTVTHVRWQGCMATIREVAGTGKLVREVNQRELIPGSDPIDGILVDFGGTKPDFHPIDHVRIVKGEIEVWS